MALNFDQMMSALAVDCKNDLVAQMRPAASPRESGRSRNNPSGHGLCRDTHVAGVYTATQMFSVSCRLAVSDARLALPNFYNITIRIANVAARLAVLVLWLCDKLGSSASP